MSVLAANRVRRARSDGKGFFVAALVTIALPAGLYLATVIEWLFVR